MRVVSIDPERCVGCYNCVYACAFKQAGDFNVEDSHIRVKVFLDDFICIPLTCVHCSDPYCLEICPSGALHRDEITKAVKIDKTRCVGCKMCMLACPFGNIHFEINEQACTKCDLCDGDPNCVKFCISGALDFMTEDEAFESKRDSFLVKLKNVIKRDK